MNKKRSTSHRKRMRWVILGIGVLFLYLSCRLFYIQVANSEEYQKKALTQWVRDTALTAARGRIIGADGAVLAQSATSYKVLLWPEQINASDHARIAKELAPLLENVSEADILEKLKDTKHREIVLKRQVGRDIVDKIEALKLGGGVVTATDTIRYYPYHSLLSQVIGFTNVDSDGQEGLELSMDKYLSGEDGRMVTEADRMGRTLSYGVQEYINPVDGCDVILTVDTNIQAILEKSLEEAMAVNNGKNAQGIVMNCKTGEIVAIATSPGYDLNEPPRRDLDALSALSRNRIVADAYEPGSTFKIITLSAALDSGTINDGFTAHCPGFRIVSGQRIKCWKAGGHGSQNLTQCTENSCNCAFMDMALRLGVEGLYDYIYKFGFGSTTGSGLSSESAGIVIHEKYIRDINLARIGFGQSVSVTPLQLVSAVSAAVNGGTLYEPRIVKEIVGADGTVVVENEPKAVRTVISEETSKTVRTILESVVNNGSGRNAQIAGYRVGGKTGTAQKYDETGIAAGKLIASFIGFAPADDPEYVTLILVDEPQVGSIFGSTVAAPFVKDVLEETLHYFGYLPEGGAEVVTVPDLRGLTTAQASEKLAEIGLGAVFQTDSEVTVQVPAAGESVLKGSEVLLYTGDMTIIDEGDDPLDLEQVKVPDLDGMSRLEAYDTLKALGLAMNAEGDYDGGRVIYQSVEKGASVNVGSTITVRFGTKEDASE